MSNSARKHERRRLIQVELAKRTHELAEVRSAQGALPARADSTASFERGMTVVHWRIGTRCIIEAIDRNRGLLWFRGYDGPYDARYFEVPGSAVPGSGDDARFEIGRSARVIGGSGIWRSIHSIDYDRRWVRLDGLSIWVDMDNVELQA